MAAHCDGGNPGECDDAEARSRPRQSGDDSRFSLVGVAEDEREEGRADYGAERREDEASDSDDPDSPSDPSAPIPEAEARETSDQCVLE